MKMNKQVIIYHCSCYIADSKRYSLACTGNAIGFTKGKFDRNFMRREAINVVNIVGSWWLVYMCWNRYNILSKLSNQ
jgi:hypothetical protein